MTHLRIKELCREQGLQLKDLAKMIGITEVGLSKSLNGNPALGRLEKIADALNVPVVELFAPQSKGDFTAMINVRGDMRQFSSIEELKNFLDNIE